MSQPTDRQLLLAMIEEAVPEHLADGLLHYVQAGRPVGSFLQAVISNDLFDACRRADPVSERALTRIVAFLYHHAPEACCGSPAAYDDWIAHKGYLGWSEWTPTQT